MYRCTRCLFHWHSIPSMPSSPAMAVARKVKTHFLVSFVAMNSYYCEYNTIAWNLEVRQVSSSRILALYNLYNDIKKLHNILFHPD